MALIVAAGSRARHSCVCGTCRCSALKMHFTLYLLQEEPGLGYGLGGPRFECRWRQEIFFFVQKVQTGFGPPNGVVLNGCQDCFQCIQRPGCDVDQSPPSSSEVKKRWSYASTPRLRLHVMDRYNLTLLYLLQDMTWICMYFRPGRVYAHIVTFLSCSLCCGPWVLDV